MSGRGKTLVAGHTLVREGAPFNDRGHVDYSTDRGWETYEGRAKCSCGEMSDVLKSCNQRKRWHREHKEAIRGGPA